MATDNDNKPVGGIVEDLPGTLGMEMGNSEAPVYVSPWKILKRVDVESESEQAGGGEGKEDSGKGEVNGREETTLRFGDEAEDVEMEIREERKVESRPDLDHDGVAGLACTQKDSEDGRRTDEDGVANKDGEDGEVERDSSVDSEADKYAEIPKIEEPIPVEHLPDYLIVKDPDNHTRSRIYYLDLGGKRSRDALKELRFARVLADSQTRGNKIAHLNLSSAPKLGNGHHSSVLQGLFRLPPPYTVPSSRTGEVTVAVKIAEGSQEDYDMLLHEGRIYASMPRYLSEDWSEFNRDGVVPVNAVVPRFYGMYILEVPEFEEGLRKSDLPAICLFEECGKPIRTPLLTTRERNEIYSMNTRLIRAGISQGSLYERNILVEPGPLSKPPSERSLETASFRIIDFGRAAVRPTGPESDESSHGESTSASVRKYDAAMKEWNEFVEGDLRRVKRTVYGECVRVKIPGLKFSEYQYGGVSREY